MAQEIKRSKNFNNTEVLLLLDLVKKFKDAVENKECGAVSFKQKNEAWVEISKQFNAESGGQPRSYKVLKEKWNNMKRNTTKSIAKIKKHMGGTGGGPSCNETLSSQETAVLEIIGDRLTGMYSECDSDIPKNAPKDSRETTILEIETDLTADHENIFILEDLDLMPASEKMVIEPSTSLEEQIDENKENDWGDFKSTLLRTPIAKPLALQNGKRKKMKVTNTMTNEKWVKFAEKKEDLLHDQVEIMKKTCNEQIWLTKLKGQLLQEEHDLKMKQFQEEHALKMAHMKEEHGLKMNGFIISNNKNQ